jgi:hypothetical protein
MESLLTCLSCCIWTFVNYQSYVPWGNSNPKVRSWEQESSDEEDWHSSHGLITLGPTSSRFWEYKTLWFQLLFVVFWLLASKDVLTDIHRVSSSRTQVSGHFIIQHGWYPQEFHSMAFQSWWTIILASYLSHKYGYAGKSSSAE